MVWTPELVRARFIEAADTERRMPRVGAKGEISGFWPSYVHSFEEMSGWGTKRLAEERELRFRRIPPSAGAVTRFEEAMDWTANRIADETRRRLVWAFAHCRANEWSFSAKCKKEGWNRVTAYDRLNAVFRRLAKELDNDSVLLRMPDEKWVLQDAPVSGINSDMAARGGGDDGLTLRVKSPRAVILPGGDATDLLKSESDLKRFARHLRRVNKARRRERERRRRRALGLDDQRRVIAAEE
jgi:uncharacterized protein DUF6362